jgi:hypothetical protein
MRLLRPSVLLLVFASACASGGSAGPETTVAASTATLITGGAANGGQTMGLTNSYTAIATHVGVSPDSAFQVLSRVYTMLEIPVAPVEQKRAVGNDEIRIRRRIAGMPMQKVLDCGQKMGLDNAETWDIHMNLLSYVQADPKGGSNVFTRIQAMGNPADASSRDLTPCASQGELEKKIGDTVLKLLNNK